MKIIRFALLLLVASAFTLPPADVKLEYAFKVGDEYTWLQYTKQTIKQSVMGMEQNTETAYDGEFKLKVVELTATGAKIEAQFITLKNTMKTAAGEMIMDSQGTDDKMETKIFKAMMNKPFYLLMNKKGVIENVEGVENLWSGFKDIGLDANQVTAMQQSMEQMMGKNSLKGSFEQAFVTYPDTKIKQGDTWKVKSGVPLNFPLLIENTWSFAGMASNTANLTADGTFTTTDKEKVINLPGGLRSKVDLSGKQAMKTNVDIKSGWPTDLNVNSELKGKMIILTGGAITENMEIPMEIFTETTFKIVKK
jgi:hypothetical protein